jgi:hypothetical protein
MERDNTMEARAICSLRDNTLTIAFNLDGRTRPTDFQPGDRKTVRMYHRDRR